MGDYWLRTVTIPFRRMWNVVVIRLHPKKRKRGKYVFPGSILYPVCCICLMAGCLRVWGSGRTGGRRIVPGSFLNKGSEYLAGRKKESFRVFICTRQ
jgi:hypothetical protein